MSVSPLLVLHISGGVGGILTGAGALTFRKGSRMHALVGKAFVASMLTMSSCATVLALMKGNDTGNVVAGVMTFYLVTTAWLTARQRDRKPGLFDWIALVFISVVTVLMFSGAFKLLAHPKRGILTPMIFFISSICALCAIGDARVIAQRGISGTRRLARHLWRMCFALFIASGSLFLARPHLFPHWMKTSGTLTLLTFLPLILLVFWMIRVRYRTIQLTTKGAAQWREKATPASQDFSSYGSSPQL